MFFQGLKLLSVGFQIIKSCFLFLPLFVCCWYSGGSWFPYLDLQQSAHYHRQRLTGCYTVQIQESSHNLHKHQICSEYNHHCYHYPQNKIRLHFQYNQKARILCLCRCHKHHRLQNLVYHTYFEVNQVRHLWLCTTTAKWNYSTLMTGTELS